MAEIIEDSITITFSKLVKTSAFKDGAISVPGEEAMSTDDRDAITAMVDELFGDDTSRVVEVS